MERSQYLTDLPENPVFSRIESLRNQTNPLTKWDPLNKFFRINTQFNVESPDLSVTRNLALTTTVGRCWYLSGQTFLKFRGEIAVNRIERVGFIMIRRKIFLEIKRFVCVRVVFPCEHSFNGDP